MKFTKVACCNQPISRTARSRGDYSLSPNGIAGYLPKMSAATSPLPALPGAGEITLSQLQWNGGILTKVVCCYQPIFRSARSRGDYSLSAPMELWDIYMYQSCLLLPAHFGLCPEQGRLISAPMELWDIYMYQSCLLLPAHFGLCPEQGRLISAPMELWDIYQICLLLPAHFPLCQEQGRLLSQLQWNCRIFTKVVCSNQPISRSDRSRGDHSLNSNGILGYLPKLSAATRPFPALPGAGEITLSAPMELWDTGLDE